jgi:hypothetical protein
VPEPFRSLWWCRRAGDPVLDSLDWSDRSSIAVRIQRTASAVEDLVLGLRRTLKETRPLGEYGARVIHSELVATGRAELDSFDIVECLTLTGCVRLEVLTAVPLHGGLPGARPQVPVTQKQPTRRWWSPGGSSAAPPARSGATILIFKGATTLGTALSTMPRSTTSKSTPGAMSAPTARRPAPASTARSRAGRYRPHLNRICRLPDGVVMLIRRTLATGTVNLLGRPFEADPLPSHRPVRCGSISAPRPSASMRLVEHSYLITWPDCSRILPYVGRNVTDSHLSSDLLCCAIARPLPERGQVRALLDNLAGDALGVVRTAGATRSA